MIRLKQSVLMMLAVVFMFSLLACRNTPDSPVSGDPSGTTSFESMQGGNSDPIDTQSTDGNGGTGDSSSTSTGDVVLKPTGNDKTNSNSQTSTSTTSRNAPTVTPIESPQEKKLESIKGSTVRVLVNSEKVGENTQLFWNMIEKKYDVKIKSEYIAYGEQLSRLGQMVASGNPPDVVTVAEETIMRLVYSNAVQSLDSYLVDDPGWTKDCKSRFKINNHIYALPTSYTFPQYFVYFNKTLFKEQKVKTPYEHYVAGTWTWKELVNTAKKMTLYRDDGVTVKTEGIGTWNYAVFMLANGGKGLTETSPGRFSVTIDQPAEMGGLQVLYQLVTDNSFYTGDCYTGFAQRKVAMHVERPGNAIGNYDYYNRMEDEIGMAPLPMADDGKYYAPMSTGGLAVPRNAKNPAGGVMYIYEAYKFDDNRALNATSGADLEDRRVWMSDEHLAIYKEYMKKATSINTYMEGLAGWWEEGTRNQFWNSIVVELKSPSVSVDSMKGILQTALKRTTG